MNMLMWCEAEVEFNLFPCGARCPGRCPSPAGPPSTFTKRRPTVGGEGHFWALRPVPRRVRPSVC